MIGNVVRMELDGTATRSTRRADAPKRPLAFEFFASVDL
jgi:hypothetical protein